MQRLSCRGEEIRKDIVRDYNVEIITFIKLLNGKTKESDAADIITDRYYEFLCTSKKDCSKKIITCGTHAGKSLINLAGLKNVKLFNPLCSENLGGNNRNNTERESTDINEKWNDVSIELYNAINILSIWLDKPLGGVLFNIKKILEVYNDIEPSVSNIKAVNTCISKCNTSITEIINKLREGNEIREFTFEKINAVLAENDIKSYF